MAAIFPPRVIAIGFNANAGPTWGGYDPLVNGGPPGGGQRSQITDVALFFDQKVNVAGQGIVLELVRPNVFFDGVWYPGGLGAIPSYTISTPLSGPNTDYLQIVGSFAGSNGHTRHDNLVALIDGAYRVRLTNGVTSKDTGVPAFPYRHAFGTLFGDTTGEEPTPGGGSTSMMLSVSTGDNFSFRGALNHPDGYRPDLDYEGDGVINTGDNLEFRSRFNKQLVWDDSSE